MTWATVTASPATLLAVPPSKWLKFTLIPLSDSIYDDNMNYHVLFTHSILYNMINYVLFAHPIFDSMICHVLFTHSFFTLRETVNKKNPDRGLEVRKKNIRGEINTTKFVREITFSQSFALQ